MTYKDILDACKKERDSLRKLIKQADKNAGWFIGSDIMQKEKKNAQKSVTRLYVKLISDNISELQAELDNYDFAPIFDIYCASEDGDEILPDILPEEVLI